MSHEGLNSHGAVYPSSTTTEALGSTLTRSSPGLYLRDEDVVFQAASLSK